MNLASDPHTNLHKIEFDHFIESYNSHECPYVEEDVHNLLIRRSCDHLVTRKVWDVVPTQRYDAETEMKMWEIDVTSKVENQRNGLCL